MLLNGHQLYGIVAELCNPGQHSLCKQAESIISPATHLTTTAVLLSFRPLLNCLCSSQEGCKEGAMRQLAHL